MAEANLLAATAEIGVQQADLYPSLTLPGQIQTGVGLSGDIVSDAALNLGAVLDIPLFDAGRRRAEVEAQEYATQSALLNWQFAVLNALNEVEGALVRIESLDAQLLELQNSEASSESAYRQLDALYREGLSSFIDVLDAQRTLISRREDLIEAEADQATAIVELYAYLAVS